MNFEERDSHWQELLKEKLDLIQTFSKENCCKVCICFELLKIAICAEKCFPEGDERDLLISRFLGNIFDEDTLASLSDKVREHFNNISDCVTARKKLENLEEKLNKCYDEFQNKTIDIEEVIKLKNDDPFNGDYLKRIEELERRVVQYEESLNNLRIENSDLKEKIMKAATLYESYMKRRKSEILSEYIQIRDEQDRLRNQLNSLKEQTDKNAENLARLQKEALKPEVRAQLELLSKDFQNWQNLFEQQKLSFDTSTFALKQASNRSQDAIKELDKIWSEIQFIRERQNDLRKWQKECKNLSKHSNNLLSAADSVYSSQQEFRDFQLIIQEKLENLRLEVEALRSQSKPFATEEYKNDVLDLRKQMDDVKLSCNKYHPGELIKDSALGGSYWSCCKGNQSSMGCERRNK
ncbi:unnamed protein product [Blepharisma stoltei]|uniref:Uncharacterized protein n=1 Tax=Blepharisma stoltei TaxID=1481888 RepID=A0AAU9ITD8_9CILI|nr:unnamed protein product [Blepharisma stoltei]